MIAGLQFGDNLTGIIYRLLQKFNFLKGFKNIFYWQKIEEKSFPKMLTYLKPKQIMIFKMSLQSSSN